MPYYREDIGAAEAQGTGIWRYEVERDRGNGAFVSVLVLEAIQIGGLTIMGRPMRDMIGHDLHVWLVKDMANHLAEMLSTQGEIPEDLGPNLAGCVGYCDAAGAMRALNTAVDDALDACAKTEAAVHLSRLRNEIEDLIDSGAHRKATYQEATA